jgi:uncharacterized membrane protein
MTELDPILILSLSKDEVLTVRQVHHEAFAPPPTLTLPHEGGGDLFGLTRRREEGTDSLSYTLPREGGGDSFHCTLPLEGGGDSFHCTLPLEGGGRGGGGCAWGRSLSMVR